MVVSWHPACRAMATESHWKKGLNFHGIVVWLFFRNLNRKNLFILTRMHSSRMGTVRCSGRLMWGAGVSAREVSVQVGVSWGGLSRGCLPGGCLSEGCLPEGVSACWVSAWGGVWPSSGVSARGCVHLPPCQNSWQTLVKTLPFRNFICGRLKYKIFEYVPVRLCVKRDRIRC